MLIADEARIQVETLRQLSPKAWKEGDVKTAIATVQHAQSQCDESTKTIEKAGPFESKTLRSTQSAALEYLTKQRVVLEKQEKLLTQGVAWTGNDSDDLQEAIDAKERAFDRFRSKWRGEEE